MIRHRLVAPPTALALLLAVHQARASPEATPSSPAAPSADEVYVELNTNDPRVRIDRVTAGGLTVPVCLAPCRQTLDRRSTYVIQGDRIVATSPFTLPDDRERVLLTVRPGYYWQRGLGMLCLGLGLAAMTVGYIMTPHNPREGEPVNSAAQWSLLVGLTGMGVAVGGFSLIAGTKTWVESSTGRSFAGAPSARPRRSAVTLTARGLEF
jgi:hypothetical protein